MNKMKKCNHQMIIMGKCKVCKKFIKWGKIVKDNPLQDLNKLAKEMYGKE